MPEHIIDPGFEDDNPLWQLIGWFGGVASRHIAGGHTGSWEAKTDTTSPTTDSCSAGLMQNLVIEPPIYKFKDEAGTLKFWLKRVAVAPGGEVNGFVELTTFDGISTRTLVYWFDWGGIGDPVDSEFNKYIVLSRDPSPVVWTEYSRNLRADYFGKFGAIDHVITIISPIVFGLLTGDKGQDIRWDDFYMDAYVVSLGANPAKAGSSLNTPFQGV